MESFLEFLVKQKKFALLSAILNTAQAVTSGLSTSPFYPLGIIMGALAGVSGAVQIAAIQSQNYASGFDGIVRSPTLMQVGVAGPERVQVTSSAKTARSGGDGVTNIYVSGSIIDRDGFMKAVNQANQGINRRFVNV